MPKMFVLLQVQDGDVIKLSYTRIKQVLHQVQQNYINNIWSSKQVMAYLSKNWFNEKSQQLFLTHANNMKQMTTIQKTYNELLDEYIALQHETKYPTEY